MRNQFIEALIKLIPQYGWSVEAMQKAAILLDRDPEYHQILFPDGVSEAREFYEAMMDAKMLEMLAEMPRPDKIRERIGFALKVRIIDLKSSYKNPSIKSIWSTADAIWYYAGDVSTDFNHYTKRGLLSAVYIASKRHYAKDDSEGFKDTEEFIARSIEKVLKIASIKYKMPKMEDIPILRLFS